MHRPPPGAQRDIAASRDITERSACGIVTGLTAASYVLKGKTAAATATRSRRTSVAGPASQEPVTGEVLSSPRGAGAGLQLTGTGPAWGNRSRACIHTPGGARRRAARPASSGQRPVMDPDTGVLPGPDSHAVKISGCAFRYRPVTGCWYPRRRKYRPSTSRSALARVTPPSYQAQQPRTAADSKARGGGIAGTRHAVNITLLRSPPDMAVTAEGSRLPAFRL